MCKSYLKEYKRALICTNIRGFPKLYSSSLTIKNLKNILKLNVDQSADESQIEYLPTMLYKNLTINLSIMLQFIIDQIW